MEGYGMAEADLDVVVRRIAKEQTKRLLDAAKKRRDQFLALAAKAKDKAASARHKQVAKDTMLQGAAIAKRLQMPEAGQGGPARGSQPKSVPSPAGGSDGDVSLVMMLDLETEVEMKLPGRFRVSPQIAGAIKAVSGVVDVQQL